MNKFATILALSGGLASAAFAATNNCGTTPGPGPILNPTVAILESTANNVNGAGLGCETINAVFSNFLVDTPGGGPDTGELNILGTLTGGTITDPQVVRLNLLPSDATDWNYNSGGSRTTTLSFNAAIDTGVLATARFFGVNAFATYSNFSSTDDITITTRICTVVVGTCDGGAGDTVIQTLVMSLNNTGEAGADSAASGTLSISGALAGLPTTIFIRTTVVLADATSNGINLSGYYMEFLETPEPSTFGMLGAALVGLGFMARRRRKT